MFADIPMDRLVLLFDAVVAVLLLATIAFAAILHRKLSVLRESQQQMEQLVVHFSEASATAERVLAELRQAAGDSGQALQKSITEGNALADDLMFLVERAGGLAKRLEGVGPAAEPRKRPAEPLTAKGANSQSGGDARPEDPRLEPATAASAAGDSDFMRALRGLR